MIFSYSEISKFKLIYNGDIIPPSVMEKLTETIINILKDKNLTSFERVGVMLDNSPGFIAAIFAVDFFDSSAVLFSTMFKQYEITRYIKQTDFRILITNEQNIDKFKELIIEKVCIDDNNLGKLYICTLENESSGNENFSSKINLDKEFILQFTSGTSGASKIVNRSYRNILSELESYQNCITHYTNDRILCIAPLYHTYGFLNGLLAAHFNNATLILSNNIQFFDIVDCITRLNATIIVASPYIYNLLTDIDISLESNKLRFCFSAGDKLPVNVITNFEKIYHTPVFQQYGTTETGVISINNNTNKQSKSTVGKILNGKQIKFVNTNGISVPKGSEGEILIKGDSVSSGYLEQIEISKKKFINGWYCTGDIGCLDDNNNIVLKGRITDTIIVSGFKVDPTEVENVILLLDDVQECYVIGQVNSRYGQDVIAFVVLKNKELSKKEIISHCRNLLADYKVPKNIRIIENIPKSPTGKVLKKYLPQNKNHEI